MEGRCLTQIELLGQIANYLKIQIQEEKRFFNLGAPQILIINRAYLNSKYNDSTEPTGMGPWICEPDWGQRSST